MFHCFAADVKLLDLCGQTEISSKVTAPPLLLFTPITARQTWLVLETYIHKAP
jgi:hypothetical protein